MVSPPDVMTYAVSLPAINIYLSVYKKIALPHLLYQPDIIPFIHLQSISGTYRVPTSILGCDMLVFLFLKM